MKNLSLLLIALLYSCLCFGQESIDLYSIQQADSCYVRGIREYNKGNYHKAIDEFHTASVINDSIERHAPFFSSNAFCWETSSYFLLGDTLSAKCLTFEYMVPPVDQRLTEESDSLFTIIEALREDEKKEEAISVLHRAIAKEKEELGINHYYVGNSLFSLAQLYNEIGKLDSVIYYGTQALSIYHSNFSWQENPNFQDLIDLLDNAYYTISDSLCNNDDYVLAYKLKIDGINLYKQLGIKYAPNLASFYKEAGICCFNLDKCDDFIYNMEKAIDIASILFENSNEYDTLYYQTLRTYATGLVYFSENFNKAQGISFLETAKQTWELVPDYFKTEEYFTCLNDLASSYLEVNLTKSTELFEELLDLKRKCNSEDTIPILANLAFAYGSTDQESYLNKAIEINKKVYNYKKRHYDKNDYEIAITCRTFARIYIRLKDANNAIKYTEKALKIAANSKGKSSSNYKSILHDLGVYKLINNDTIGGIECLKKSIELSSTPEPIDYNTLATLFGTLSEDDSCYYYQKHLSEIVKNDVLCNLNVLSHKDIPDYLNTTLTRTYFFNSSGYAMKFPQNLDLQRLAYEDALFLKNLGVNIFKNKKNNVSTTSLTPRWTDILEMLEEKEVAVEFLCKKKRDEIYMFVLRKGWDAPKVIEINIEKIFETRDENDNVVLPMYDIIWHNIIEQGFLKEGETVYIAPDGIIQSFVFESACDYNWEYMSDKYNIYRLSSTTKIKDVKMAAKLESISMYGGLHYNMDKDSLFHQQNLYISHRSAEDLYFLEDSISEQLRSNINYLPWTKNEVDTIFNITSNLNPKSHIIKLTGDDGIEESIKSISGDSPQILHIATHGFFRSPEYYHYISDYEDYCMENSGLLFSGVLNNKDLSRFDDGILRANEIKELDLSNTDLVVLSACDTGLGGTLSLDGISGLQRAFKMAGVNTIIMSMWKIDDLATYTFMINFYKQLLLLRNKHDAFYKARDILKTSEEFSDYRYWSAFIMLD